MKTKLALLLLLLAAYKGIFAQCGYYFFQNNKTVTIGIFNKKGNADGKVVYKTREVTASGGNSTAALRSEVFDRKDKSVAVSSGTVQCKGGVLLMDMKMMMAPQQSGQLQWTETSAKGMYLEYPSSLSVGQDLKDGSFEMDMKMATGIPASVSLDITDRHVVAKEKVSTPAGSWDAYKITYQSKMLINMGFGVPFKMETTEWFVPGFGVVRTESKYGKTELLSIE
ncbi:hypothetical protein [Niabella sp.]|uniref:TapB family protein n=1 Tax=Niabella sp. TaxID=1962976 RepID=UPI0026389A97|nr:hypothetical protein [Niabella sp.]